MFVSPLHTEAQQGHSSPESFETLYLQLRKKEKRIYSDDEVKNLPSIRPSDPHYKEWLLRKKTSERLIKYLLKKNRPLNILETGCGNGWLSARMAKTIPGSVMGIDINKEELRQAARVFSKVPNLVFIAADMYSGQLNHKHFDIIVFAASLQYFSSAAEILQSALQFVKPGGEIHIIDTVFYPTDSIGAAQRRTEDYYTQLGFPEAAAYYFHHCLEDLDNFETKILYNPRSWLHQFSKKKNPFYWLCIPKLVDEKGNP